MSKITTGGVITTRAGAISARREQRECSAPQISSSSDVRNDSKNRESSSRDVRNVSKNRESSSSDVRNVRKIRESSSSSNNNRLVIQSVGEKRESSERASSLRKIYLEQVI